MGARLSNLLWTWRLARGMGARTLAFWPPFDSYYGEVNGIGDLLDMSQLAASSLREELAIVDGRPADHIHPRLINLSSRERCDPRLYAVSPAAMAGGRDVPIIHTAVGPLLTPGETKGQAIREARELFAQLPLQLGLRNALKRASRTYNLNRMVAVHVRRGDIVDVLGDASANFGPESLEPSSPLDRYTEHFFRCCPPTAGYLRLVRPYLKQGFRVLFFSDSPGAARPFTKRFGDKIVLGDDLAPSRMKGLQRAMFELVLMSRCHVILGAKSLFSSLASVAGGAELIDARHHASADEFLAAYKSVTRFDSLSPAARAGVTEVLLRNVQQNNVLKMWSLAGEDVLRLLEAPIPA
jgi:hypothetical protein